MLQQRHFEVFNIITIECTQSNHDHAINEECISKNKLRRPKREATYHSFTTPRSLAFILLPRHWLTQSVASTLKGFFFFFTRSGRNFLLKIKSAFLVDTVTVSAAHYKNEIHIGIIRKFFLFFLFLYTPYNKFLTLIFFPTP